MHVVSPVQPLLYIVVRRTTDWSDEATVRAQLPDGFAPLVELWNTTFDMPFHVFRQELKDIAGLSHSCVRNATVTALDNVPEGALVAPTDDDDWFSPDLAQALTPQLKDSRLGYFWTSRFLEVPVNWDAQLGIWRRKLLPRTPHRWICTTNNHAVVNADATRDLLGSHVRASAWFEANPTKVEQFAASLSVQNRNLASQTTLLFRRGEMTRSRLLRKYRRYRSLYERPCSAGLEWSRPYVAGMVELMARLRPRRG